MSAERKLSEEELKAPAELRPVSSIVHGAEQTVVIKRRTFNAMVTALLVLAVAFVLSLIHI